MTYLSYFLVLIMGVILGLFGGGGSILSVPILIYGFDLPASIATSYSLFLVGSTALFGSLIYGYKRQIDWKTGLYFSFPALIATYITRKFFIPFLPNSILSLSNFNFSKDHLILIIFVLTMVISSLSMIKVENSKFIKNKDLKLNPATIFEIILKSLGIGILSGFIGAGGGFLIVPALFFLFGLEIKTASATSLLVIAINSLSGFAAEISHNSINWNLLFTLLLLALIGNIFGIILNKFVSGQKLKTSFGYFTLLVAVFITIQELIKILN